ncbi:choice-of-anchor A family protein [Massilia sp. TWP1-3-3]|uniref:choice-of-anchor A family protein n=1 Tax=Massilia sp. TWP1-3-3 TaxID=2804573 RepID=UPI003CF7803B
MMQAIQARKLRRLACAALAMLCLQGAAAQKIDLGAAGQYAAFILGDASGLARVEGRMAVGRDLDSNNLDIGADLPSSAAAQPSLVVGRTIKTFKHGDIRADSGRKGYGVFGTSAANTSSQLDLRKEELAVDFVAEASWLSMLTARLAAKPVTGSAKTLANILTLQGTNASQEVFELTAAQVGPSFTVQLLNVKPGATLIVNVRANAQRQVKFSWNQNALRGFAGRLLFNFPDTDTLTFNGAGVWGTLLAPFACISSSGGHLFGSVIGASWTGQTTIGNTPFVPAQSP